MTVESLNQHLIVLNSINLTQNDDDFGEARVCRETDGGAGGDEHGADDKDR